MTTPIKVMVTQKQAAKIAQGHSIITIQVRRKAGEAAVWYRANLTAVQEIKPPYISEDFSELHGDGFKPPELAMYDHALREATGLIGHDDMTSRPELPIGRQLFAGRFAGVYALGEKPKLTAAKPYAIWNTANPPGKHWRAMAHDPSGSDIVYDPLGGGVGTDPDAEQSDVEQNCGQRALAFLIVCDRDGLAVARKI